MPIVRHMAAAVLYAVVNLLAAADSSAAVALELGTASDDDAIECVAFTADPSQRERSLVLTTASRLCGEQIDDAWVMESHGRPAAAAAVHQSTSDHVAVIDLSSDAGSEHRAGRLLLARALDRCRETGAVKVIVQTSVFDTAATRSTAESRGFRFSRTRESYAGVAQLEFYTDLYWSPPRNADAVG